MPNSLCVLAPGPATHRKLSHASALRESRLPCDDFRLAVFHDRSRTAGDAIESALKDRRPVKITDAALFQMVSPPCGTSVAAGLDAPAL
jgi:hypothetical protein